MRLVTRSSDSASVIDRLQKQASVFGNPRRIITDRGTTFTARSFEEYGAREVIQHLLFATGVPCGNVQVERINRIILYIAGSVRSIIDILFLL